MKKQITKKKISKMIYSGFIDLSVEDIKKLIKDESAKDEDQIDVEFIDMCFDLLSIKQNRDLTKKKYYKKTMKALLIAAVIIIVLVSSVAAFAQAFHFSIPQEIAKFIDGDARIDMNFDKADTEADGYSVNTDLINDLANHGITSVTIPSALSSDNCKITNIEYPNIDNEISIDAGIVFEYNDFYGNMTIIQYAQEFDWVGENVVEDIKSGQLIKVNGLDVLLFEQENGYNIEYKDSLTSYSIYLECDLKTAICFVETIS